MNGIGFLESTWLDLRYATRTLVRSPVFTLVVVASLALGIGANTAIFTLINAVLLKMLAVGNPEQLVAFKNVNPAFSENNGFSYQALKEFRDRNQVFSGLLAFYNLEFRVNVEVDAQGGAARGQAVSGDYFSTLQVQPIVGRTIALDDEKSANPVAVISYGYWMKRFALDPGIIGKKILINNSPFTIVGVTPPDFFGLEPGSPVDVSFPLKNIVQVNPGLAMAGTRADILAAPFRTWLSVMGRLKPGSTKETASASMQPVFHEAMREAVAGLSGLEFDSPAFRQSYLASQMRLESGGQGLATLRQKYSKPLWILMTMTGLLLLVTCANVANLMLARANARQREVAVRLTVGASRLHLVRQFFTESVLLAVTGGAVGLIVAFVACGSLLPLMLGSNALLSVTVRPDAVVLGFTLTISVITALLSGSAPIWQVFRLKGEPTLTQATRSRCGSGNRSKFGKALVITQIAVSFVLVVGAGLLVRSLQNLKDFYPGFNKDNVLLFSTDPGTIGYQGEQVIPVDTRLLESLKQIPGVRSATFSFFSPLTSQGSTRPKIDGPVTQSLKAADTVGINEVGPNYFSTLQISAISGRDFTDADRNGSPKVAVINQRMARDYFGDSNPIGRHLSVVAWNGDPSWRSIVGVMKDAKTGNLRESPKPMIYLPLFQSLEGAVTFEVRTAIDPHLMARTIMQAVKATDSRMPVSDIKTLDEQIDQSLSQERLVALISSLFGVLALFLAGVGLYGLMAYTVNRRTGEIGIRMALGAARGQVVGMILFETLGLILIGLGIGVPIAFAASQLLRTELYGLKPSDPITALTAVSIMAGVAVLSACAPAMRASRVEPIVALRTE